MKNIHLTLVPLSIALLVAGCGGGGGGTTGSQAPTATVQIDSTNAPKFASGAVSSSQQATGAARSGNAQVGVKSLTQPTLTSHDAANLAMSEFNRVLNMSLPTTTVTRGTTSTKAITPTAYLCSTLNNLYPTQVNPGTANSVGISGSGVSVGNSFTLTYTSCSYGGVTMNGNMTFAINSVVGTSSASITTAFTNFSAVVGTNTVTMNGDMSISYSGTGTSVTSTISGNSFTIGVNSDSFTMYAYSETYTLYSTYPYNYTYSLNMSLSLTSVGIVEITTTTPFGGSGSGNPTTGSMKISGTKGTYVTMTANPDGLHADLSVYDGTNTTNSSVLWTAL